MSAPFPEENDPSSRLWPCSMVSGTSHFVPDHQTLVRWLSYESFDLMLGLNPGSTVINCKMNEELMVSLPACIFISKQNTCFTISLGRANKMFMKLGVGSQGRRIAKNSRLT